MAQLDSSLLDNFANTFYGYGNLKGRYWCIGMEEGGGNSLEEVACRLSTWKADGEPELEDVVSFHNAMRQGHWFAPPVTLQTTWSKLIQIIMSCEQTFREKGAGEIPTSEVRLFQQKSLARSGGNNCLLEIMPLPSPGTGTWLYGNWSDLPWLVARETYIKHYQKRRMNHLMERVAKCKPAVVIFYGLGYQAAWDSIAGIMLPVARGGPIAVAVNNGTVFALVSHPAAHGVTSQYFHGVGVAIAQALVNAGLWP